MKTVLVTEKEMEIINALMENLNLEVSTPENLVTYNELPIVINNKLLKMVNEGENEIDGNNTLFLPMKSTQICNYLISLLYEEDNDITVYMQEEDGLCKLKIEDSDKNELSKSMHRDYKIATIRLILNFYLGENKILV